MDQRWNPQMDHVPSCFLTIHRQHHQLLLSGSHHEIPINRQGNQGQADVGIPSGHCRDDNVPHPSSFLRPDHVDIALQFIQRRQVCLFLFFRVSEAESGELDADAFYHQNAADDGRLLLPISRVLSLVLHQIEIIQRLFALQCGSR